MRPCINPHVQQGENTDVLARSSGGNPRACLIWCRGVWWVGRAVGPDSRAVHGIGKRRAFLGRQRDAPPILTGLLAKIQSEGKMVVGTSSDTPRSRTMVLRWPARAFVEVIRGTRNVDFVMKGWRVHRMPPACAVASSLNRGRIVPHWPNA
jgi:hypothetical protein